MLELLERDLFFKLIRHGELNCLFSAVTSAIFYNTWALPPPVAGLHLHLPSALQGHYCSLVIFWNLLSPCREILAMLPHVTNLFSKITKQFIDQSQQTVYPTPSPADKEGQGYLSVPVPAGAVPTIPTQRHCKQWARAGTGRSWASLCQIHYG